METPTQASGQLQHEGLMLSDTSFDIISFKLVLVLKTIHFVIVVDFMCVVTLQKMLVNILLFCRTLNHR